MKNSVILRDCLNVLFLEHLVMDLGVEIYLGR